MTPEELRVELEEYQDLGYREFHLRTCPQAAPMIGVRVPEQRRLAKKIAKGDFWYFLDQVRPEVYEEKMITGIVIATAPMSLDDRFGYTAWFVPLIDNWATCDGFCASFRLKTTELGEWWDFLMKYRTSQQEYELRFMFVMILNHFVLEGYLTQIFMLLDEIKSDAYYVEMAKAWLVAELFIKFRDQTLEYLRADQLSVFAHNKAIQKACESRRVSDDDKQTLRGLKL